MGVTACQDPHEEPRTPLGRPASAPDLRPSLHHPRPTPHPYGRTLMNDAPTCCQPPFCFTNQVTLTANFWRMPLTLNG